jgi:hypothetical protein
MRRTLKLLLFFLFILQPEILFASGQPFIDMHFHAWPNGADAPPDHPKNIKGMQESLKQFDEVNLVFAATSGPQAFLEAWSKVKPKQLALGPIFPCDGGLNPNWYRYQCFDNGTVFPDIEWLEQQYISGKYKVMGELYNQYAGIPYVDPRMFPYYEMAERLGIPVLFHCHSAPPKTAYGCCPNFRLSLGNPMLIEEVLVLYPKLKVQIAHANPIAYPMILDLLFQYPQVYVDLSPFDRLYKRDKFYRLLKEFKDANLIKRVVYGSDGGKYAKAQEVYSGADFLTERDIEGIFCRNAAKFMGKKELCE